MLYIIGQNVETKKYHGGTDDIVYTLFETNTQSIIFRGESYILELLDNYDIKIENADIIDGAIVLHKWPNQIYTQRGADYSGSEYTLITKVNDDRFKVVSVDEGEACIDASELRARIESKSIANCDCAIVGGEPMYRCTDVIQLITNTKSS